MRHETSWLQVGGGSVLRSLLFYTGNWGTQSMDSCCLISALLWLDSILPLLLPYMVHQWRHCVPSLLPSSSTSSSWPSWSWQQRPLISTWSWWWCWEAALDTMWSRHPCSVGVSFIILDGTWFYIFGFINSCPSVYCNILYCSWLQELCQSPLVSY